ncbi:unnamed protein product, partial [Pylaiella littoralis]
RFPCTTNVPLAIPAIAHDAPPPEPDSPNSGVVNNSGVGVRVPSASAFPAAGVVNN